MTLPSLIRLSQGHLNTLTLCPPWFQKTLVEHCQIPPTSDQQAKLTWGKNFHLLMQQQQLGLDIGPFLAQDPELAGIFVALKQQGRELFEGPQERFPEHPRTLKQDNYLLTGIYDLLILEPKQAQIIDWKTYPKPQKSDRIKNNWQTRLYLYLLAETSGYVPEQISFTYWFVRQSPCPESLTLHYTQNQHQETKQELRKLLTNLGKWLEEKDFPHQLNCQSSCPYASYLKMDNPPQANSGDMLEKIAEIPI